MTTFLGLLCVVLAALLVTLLAFAAIFLILMTAITRQARRLRREQPLLSGRPS